MIIAETIMQNLPETCFDCDLFRSTMLKCMPKQVMFDGHDFHWLKDQKPSWCPLKEVELKNVKVVDDEGD